jgi:hypothetical protein
MMNNNSGIPRREDPWSHVGIVIETTDDDLVSRFPAAADCSGELHRQSRHVGTENDALRISNSKKHRNHTAGFIKKLIGASADLKDSTTIAVGVPQVTGNGIDHTLRNLTAGRTVKMSDRNSTETPLQRREQRSDSFDRP